MKEYKTKKIQEGLKISKNNLEITYPSKLDEEEYYRNQIKLNPEDIWSLTKLANLLKRKGLIEEAKEIYLKVIKIQPFQAMALNNLSDILIHEKKFDEAFEKYIEARELFKKISWNREVSRINNDLLPMFQRERKRTETLDEVKLYRKRKRKRKKN